MIEKQRQEWSCVLKKENPRIIIQLYLQKCYPTALQNQLNVQTNGITLAMAAERINEWMKEANECALA